MNTKRNLMKGLSVTLLLSLGMNVSFAQDAPIAPGAPATPDVIEEATPETSVEISPETSVEATPEVTDEVIPEAPAEVAPFEFNEAPKLVEKTSDSVTLSWEAIDGATSYIVSYDTQSIENSDDPELTYENESDLIDLTQTKVEGLSAGQTYYFSLIAIDENAEETPYSSELSVSVEAEASAAPAPSDPGALALQSVIVLSKKHVQVQFNNQLDASEDADRDVKITPKSDEATELEVDTIEVKDGSSLIVTLLEDVAENTEYTVTIISLQDANGKNVESGVDGVKSVMTPETLMTAEAYIEMNTVLPEPVVVPEPEPEPVLMAAPVEEEEEEEPAPTPEPRKLPETGAKEIFVLIAALLLGLVLLTRRKA